MKTADSNPAETILNLIGPVLCLLFIFACLSVAGVKPADLPEVYVQQVSKPSGSPAFECSFTPLECHWYRPV